MKSAVIFDHIHHLDSYRQSFLQSLTKYIDNVYYFNLHQTSFDELTFVKELEYILKSKDIQFFLSLNGYGIEKLQQSFNLKEFTFPRMIWYWDSPVMFPLPKEPEDFYIFLACKDYSRGIKSPKVNWSWLPFAGSEPQPVARTDNRDILFVGSCWHVTQVAEQLAGGLKKLGSEEVLFGGDLYKKLEDLSFFDDTWLDMRNKPVSPQQVLNYLASIKRQKYLSILSKFDLEIKGHFDWLINTWTHSPNLLKCTTPGLIGSKQEMDALSSQFKLNVNIFHPQNTLGGPNFRIFDCAASYTPIFSDYNEGCAELFPEGEAAVYFRDENECLSKTDELLCSPKLRQTIANRAAQLLKEKHLHDHRWISIFQTCDIHLYSNTNGKITFAAPPLKNKTPKITSDTFLISQEYEIAKYWAGFRESTIETDQFHRQRIQNLLAENEILRTKISQLTNHTQYLENKIQKFRRSFFGQLFTKTKKILSDSAESR